MYIWICLLVYMYLCICCIWSIYICGMKFSGGAVWRRRVANMAMVVDLSCLLMLWVDIPIEISIEWWGIILNLFELYEKLKLRKIYSFFFFFFPINWIEFYFMWGWMRAWWEKLELWKGENLKRMFFFFFFSIFLFLFIFLFSFEEMTT